MRLAVFVLLGVLVIQQALTADGQQRKVKKTKGPFLGPWIQSHRKQILSQKGGKHKAPKNISQAILAGENEGVSMPWYALLQTEDGICGGALVNNRYILSATGCLYYPRDDNEPVKVILGAYSDTQTTDKSEFIISSADYWFHPDNDNDHDIYDITLIKLYEDVVFNDFIAPIQIWKGDPDITSVTVKFAGMGGNPGPQGGWVFPTGLQDKTQVVQPEDYCISALGADYYKHEMHFCTANPGEEGVAVWGDDGGPVFYTDGNGAHWLVGIISYQADENYDAGFPSKHIRLSFYLCYLEALANSELGFIDLASCPVAGGDGAPSQCDLKRRQNIKKFKKKHAAKKSKSRKVKKGERN